MIKTYTHNKITWIDLESPTKEEVMKIMDAYGIDPLIVQELISPSIKPKMEIYHDFAFLVLHFPTFRKNHATPIKQEIDFIIGKNMIITTHYDVIDPLHKFARAFEVSSLLNKTPVVEHAGFIFFYMMQKIYNSLIVELEFIDDSLRSIESNVFSGKERDMVFDLSNVSRSLLDFKQATLHHKEILENFEKASKPIFGEEFSWYISLLLNEYQKINETIKNQWDLLSELRATNNSLLETKQNETMKVFTILAFFAFPLTLLVQILTISSPYNPILGKPGDFQTIVTIVLAGAIAMFFIFKYKKWL
jgi:magnesium transporter